ncbi:MAG: ribosomal RNA small subunit methyltransferase A [Proteobacteria bacterium]|nr:ribosomal RNA small subunit methyltransferase A [Pseudomonadota bacterium]
MTRFDLTPQSLVEGLQRRLKKSLGQNFLIDENVTRTIAREVDNFRPLHILEIGPGAGALTLALCRLELPITVLEKDDHCAKYVQNIFGEMPEFCVIHGDALNEPLPEFCSQAEARAILVSNLPYNVASQIYFRFIDADLPLVGMVLMFQREVAQRFIAKPGSKHYSALSVVGQYYHEIEHVLDVLPESFRPAPKVTSTVLRFVPRKRELSEADEQRFRRLVHAAFALRRKTLSNSLAGYLGLDKTAWAEKLSQLGFEPTVRAEALSFRDFIRILNVID